MEREAVTIHGKVFTPGREAEGDRPAIADVPASNVRVRLGRGGSVVGTKLTDAGGNFSFPDQPWKPGFQLAVEGLDVEPVSDLDDDEDGVFQPTGPGTARVDFHVTL